MDSVVDGRLRLRWPAVAVWRSAGVLQVGLDAPGVVLDGVPGRLSEALALLARPSSPAELARLLPGLDRSWIDWLVERLAAAGLLTPHVPAPAARVAVVGRDVTARTVAAALTHAGLDARIRGLEAIAADVTDADSTPDLIVLAAPTVEPDRALTDELLRAGRPHLVVRVEPDRAVVGPLVIPGRTPCIRCVDLSRCRLDSAWPHLLAQLCREPVEPEPALLAWAATTAAVQARAWVAGNVPETSGSTLELGLADFRLRSRNWPAHPRCGCLVPIG